MDITIYHNPRWGKSRQTLQILNEAGKDCTVIEYLKETPSSRELEAVFKKIGIPPSEGIRKNETEFKENNISLPFGLYITNSVQEEVGLRGAEMIVETIKPDVAIVTDVTHDTYTPMINKIKQGDKKCGDGPVLYYGPAVQNNLLDLIFTTAEKNKIPFQRGVVSRATGTDTDAFAFSTGGVASALISLPLRYMHTTVESVSKKDVENVILLIYNLLQKIKNNHDFRYLK